MNYKYSGYAVNHSSISPQTAALLSIVPGLGQMYVGDRRKGLLFLDVAAVNFALLWLLLCGDPIVKMLTKFGSVFHIQLNEALLHVLSTRLGSPGSSLFLASVVLFVLFAVHDAYQSAVVVRRKKIYPEQVIDLSEATSGSYLLHFALMTSFLFVSIFFLIPAPPVPQVTVIEFIDNEQLPVPTKVKSKIISQTNSRATGKFDRSKTPATASSPSNSAKAAAPDQPSSMHPVKAQEAQKTAPTEPVKSSSMPQQVKPVAPQLVKPVVPQPVKPAVTQPTHPSASQPVMPAVPQPIKPAVPMLPTASKPLAQSTLAATTTPTRSVLLPTPSADSRRTAIQTPTPIAPRSILVAQAIPSVAPLSINRTAGLPSPAMATGKNSIPNPVPGFSPIRVASQSGSSPQPIPISPGDSSWSASRATDAPAPSRVASKGKDAGAQFGRPLAVLPGGSANPQQASGQNPGSQSNASPNNRTGKQSPESSQAEFGPYMAALQKRIRRNWFPPHGDTRRVVVIFKIHSGGVLSGLRIDHSSGVATVDNAALMAVNNSAPFPELPPNSPEDVDIQFTFDYNVFGGSQTGSARHF